MAVRTERRDLTTLPLEAALARLALPTAAETALFQGVELTNAYWMGRLGGSALAAVTMGMLLRLVLISPMMGLSLGGLAVVARRLGEKDQAAADRAVMQTILLLVAFTALAMLVGMTLGTTFLQWMGAEGVLLEQATAYLRIIFPGLFFLEMLPTMNGVIRAAGYPEQPLRTHLCNLGVVLVVEPLLVLGVGPFPAMGVRAAAWATVLGSAAGVGYQLLILWRGWAGVQLHLADLRPDWGVMRRILQVALPAAAQSFSPNLGNALMVRLVAFWGEDALTAYSLLTRLVGVGQWPAVGLSAAAAALVGQNMGARQPERAERATELAIWSSLGLSLALYGVLAILPRPILGVFRTEEAVLAAGAALAAVTPVWGSAVGWTMILGNSLGGAGDSVSPMIIGLGRLWLLQIPLCWALSRWTPLGATGLWIGLGLSNLLAGVAIYLRFKQGAWKRVRL